MEKKQKPDPYEGMDPKAKREAMRKAAWDQMFGPPPTENPGNMWGWKFSVFGLVLLIGMFAFLAYGLRNGLIDLKEQTLPINKSKRYIVPNSQLDSSQVK